MTAIERIPREFIKFIASWHAAEFILDFDQPAETFLIRKSMQWTRQTVQRCGEGKVWIGQSRTNQMHGVR